MYDLQTKHHNNSTHSQIVHINIHESQRNNKWKNWIHRPHRQMTESETEMKITRPAVKMKWGAEKTHAQTNQV